MKCIFVVYKANTSSFDIKMMSATNIDRFIYPALKEGVGILD